MDTSMDAELPTVGNELVLRPKPTTGTITTTRIVLPAILTSAGDGAVTRFAEYFTVIIQNPHTLRAYFRNAVNFLKWCEDRGVTDLKAIKPMMVAAFIEHLKPTHAKPSVKQHLATVRMLFDWLVTGHVVETNPAHSVRGPKHVVTKGPDPRPRRRGDQAAPRQHPDHGSGRFG